MLSPDVVVRAEYYLGLSGGSTYEPVRRQNPGGPLLDFHPRRHCVVRTSKPAEVRGINAWP